MGYAVHFKIDGIAGEGADPDRRDWMALESFCQSLSGPSGRGAAPMILDFGLSRFSDRATPLLARAAAEGRYFRSAVLQLAETDGARAVFLEIRMTRVKVTNFNISGNASQDLKRPYENFSLSFEKIEWTYFPGSDGECRTDWVNEAAETVA